MVKTPTFATSLESVAVRRLSSLRGPGVFPKGFTLLELLVVLAIGAVLVALVPPAFERLREISQYRDTVRAVVVDLRQARHLAQAFGQPVLFTINLADRQFGIVGRPFKSIPASLEIKTTVGTAVADAPLAVAIGDPTIVFTPEGGSTGGSIELVRPSGDGLRIKVDWLFGQITQEPRSP